MATELVVNTAPSGGGSAQVVRLLRYADETFNGLKVGLLAAFCDKVYDVDENDRPKWGHTHPSWTHPEGWIVDHVFFSKRCGFMAVLYRNNADSVLCFRGSDIDCEDLQDWHNFKRDWLTDVMQGVGWPTEQYSWAIKVAREVIEAHQLHPSNKTLTFTGHSLGGGLAACAAVFSGVVPTLTFNGAGLHEAQRLRALQERDGGYERSRVCLDSMPSGRIVAYHVDGEFLNTLQQAAPGGTGVKKVLGVEVAAGQTVVLPVAEADRSKSLFELHAMSAVLNSLQKLRGS